MQLILNSDPVLLKTEEVEQILANLVLGEFLDSESPEFDEKYGNPVDNGKISRALSSHICALYIAINKMRGAAVALKRGIEDEDNFYSVPKEEWANFADKINNITNEVLET